MTVLDWLPIINQNIEKWNMRKLVYLWHDGYSCCRSVYTTLCFCLRNTLDSMNTRFILELAIDTISFNLHHTRLVTSMFSLIKVGRLKSYTGEQHVSKLLCSTAIFITHSLNAKTKHREHLTSEHETIENFQELRSLYL